MEDLRKIQEAFPGSVVISHLGIADCDSLFARGKSRPDALPRSVANRALLEAWADFLAPCFGSGSCNLTGTYSDAYGYSHGLMLARNVIKDFQRFRRQIGRGSVPACLGVEYHPTTHRAILHFHALIGGEWDPSDIRYAESLWTYERGWAVAKPVTDREGCVEYAAKHLLKQGSDDTFDFMLPAISYKSRVERRWAQSGRM